jgi:hypothetical protein
MKVYSYSRGGGVDILNFSQMPGEWRFILLAKTNYKYAFQTFYLFFLKLHNAIDKRLLYNKNIPKTERLALS